MSLGKAKAILDRQRNYAQIITSSMVAIMFFQQNGWHWWYLFALLIWPIFIWFDLKKIWPNEIDYQQSKSTAFRTILGKEKTKEFEPHYALRFPWAATEDCNGGKK